METQLNPWSPAVVLGRFLGSSLEPELCMILRLISLLQGNLHFQGVSVPSEVGATYFPVGSEAPEHDAESLCFSISSILESHISIVAVTTSTVGAFSVVSCVHTINT